MADNPHKEHRRRMKAQYLLKGAEAFQEHQLVEMLLFFGIPQGDTNPLAHALLERFGSIQGILQATTTQLLNVKGVGEHTAVLLNLCGVLVRKCGEELRPIGCQLTSADEYGHFLLPRFWGETDEVVYLVSLNNRNEVLNCTLITRGSINATEVNMRLVLQQALIDNATKIIIAHNHPSGIAVPSKEDVLTTTRLATMVEGAGIRIVDHVIIADGDFVSMRDTSTLKHLFKG